MGRRFPDGPPPLSLYVHWPWCVRKCPYCDFNSHSLGDARPELAYVDALLADLDRDLSRCDRDRPLISVFIGGGTPSLMSGAAVARLLDGIRARTLLPPDAEVTLEANPGTVDAGHFSAYREAGVNRLSIGVQSLSAQHLEALGRIHTPEQAEAAAITARRSGFENINLDLMFGLPGQTLAEAAADLNAVLALTPEHISYYQLTLEPNTRFYRAPPALPDEDLIDDMHGQGLSLLAEAGFRRYEISAFARPGRRCRHNLNYWTFGDYLGIGAGAHGKLTDAVTGQVRRRAKHRQPGSFMDSASRGRDPVSSERMLDDDDLVLEFALNAFRLVDGVGLALFEQRTGLRSECIGSAIAGAVGDGLLTDDRGWLRPTALGLRFDNLLIGRFAD
jgi:oxygen-independent coproporphyrinogen-3 oxidase